MKAKEENLLMTRKEAAEFLGIKEMTLAAWKRTQRYDLPVVKVGRLVRYRFSDLVTFLDKRTVSSTHPTL